MCEPANGTVGTIVILQPASVTCYHSGDPGPKAWSRTTCSMSKLNQIEDTISSMFPRPLSIRWAGRRVHVRAVGSLKVSRRPRNMYQTFRYVQYDQPTISHLRRPYILPGCSSGLQFPEHRNKSPTGSAAFNAALAYAKRYQQLASRLCKAQLLGRASYGVGTERTTIFVAAGGAELLSLPRN